jgi:hypothetical protein
MATLLRPVSSAALERLAACPSVPLGCWPTPLERLGPAGSAVGVNRDDLSGWGRGGAKARKLEYLLGHVRAHEYSEVITVTGNATNLVFDILPALDISGLGSRILVVNYPCERPSDREATPDSPERWPSVDPEDPTFELDRRLLTTSHPGGGAQAGACQDRR